MPFANLKVPEGLLDEAQKKRMVDTITDMYVQVFGERCRSNTMVLIEEVVDGGWGIGGNVLTCAMLTKQDGD